MEKMQCLWKDVDCPRSICKFNAITTLRKPNKVILNLTWKNKYIRIIKKISDK